MCELIIEVTRSCNLDCYHCLRGEAECLNIDNKHITEVLGQLIEAQLDYAVTFTGGEPTLNLNAIKHYIAESKRLGVTHQSFYIATNGNDTSIDFAEVCLQLYAMANDKEICQVQLSNDMQHETGYINTELMDGLKFFGKKHENDYFNYFDRNSGVLYEGTAKDYMSEDMARPTYIKEVVTKDDIDETEIYLNCKGNIINGCNWSYDSQDNRPELLLCKVEDLAEFYNGLKQEEYA
jgi:organic radical activating enzyme